MDKYEQRRNADEHKLYAKYGKKFVKASQKKKYEISSKIKQPKVETNKLT